MHSLTSLQSTLVTTLHTSLRSLRQSYLSTAAPRKSHLRTSSRSSQPQPVSLTDRDREEIDANAKRTFRDLSARIRALEDAEQLRQSTEAALITKKYARGLGGALGSWAAGGIKNETKKSAEHLAAEGRARQLGAHRESVVLYLKSQLGEAVKTQQGMMETRLTREVEKSRSVLAKARGPVMGGIPEVGTGMPRRTSVGQQQSSGEREEEGRGMDEITEEQMQMFEKGNQDMLKHYESTLDKVR
jgi:syntaxin 18